MEFNGFSADEARTFAARWLPAWTGGDASRLAAFYSDDVFYCDPGLPSGVQGKAALIKYFEKLLGHNPGWVWKHVRSVPIQDGFLNHWRAEIPVRRASSGSGVQAGAGAGKTVICTGVCSVQLRDGLIYRNEVFFDRSELLREIMASQQ